LRASKLFRHKFGAANGRVENYFRCCKYKMPNNVEVVFDVTIDASGTVSVFSYPKEAVANVIVAETTLPSAVLYTDASAALIKFRGWSGAGNVEDISGIRHTPFLASGVTNNASLSSVINGAFDCSGAKPFDGYKATNVSEYYRYSSFGAAMLGAYAHYLFGHVQATAAIDNDQAFVSDMNSESAGKAQIATRLLAALDALTPEKATSVAKQVIGQDAERARNVDNDLNNPDGYQMLQFIAQDIIYVKVKLAAPVVTVTANRATQLGEPLAAAYNPSTADATYMMKITLA
jgi:hypothetical protein